MDTLQFLVSVFLILLKCEESTMQNVTFYNTPKTWKSAANFCSHNGRVLESNVTILKKLNEFINAEKDVWIGKFKTLTKWTYIQGCYLLNGKFQHFKLERSQTLELQCQMLCEEDQFYSIKEEDCYCIANISSFVRKTNCNCDGCYKVWKHQLSNFSSTDERANCIAAEECAFGKLKRSYQNCAKTYYVTCDNGANLNYTYGENYHAAAQDCEERGSFIKWYSDSVCETTDFPIYWTSGTRYTETFRLRKPYFTENLQPEECYILKKDGREDYKNCNTDKKRFFCRLGTDEDKGDIISIPDLSMTPQKNVRSDNSGSIAAGIVTSIIVVIAVISVLVLIHRRRLSRKKPTSHESQNNTRLQDTVGLPSNHEISKAPIYHEIDNENFGPRSGKLNCSRAVNNITYDQTPNSKNVNQSANSSILTNLNSIEHQRKFGQTEYDMPKVINVTGNSYEGANANNYCLAEPITNNTEEELDPYDINKDYDHLNNVQKKENPFTKVYDHLPTTVTDDPTYDHSNLKSALDNEDFYDHFKNEGDND
ncbi:uncharacterized protein LOC143054266 [Mytilus galloprovincialis]|uniref:uncharacterized protein LOC143054266 n=1 Tax=Mytilus galloprovincialis TaxID=29158 RepID=UPI003F7B3DF1